MALIVQRRRRHRRAALGTITEILLPSSILPIIDATPKQPTKPPAKKLVALHSNYLGDDAAPSSATQEVSDFLSSDTFKMGAGAALIFHGYRRTNSLVWALLYGLAGRELPMFALPIAVAQGFGKRKICTTE